MKLYIMRHGDAEPPVTSDSARQLSSRGELQAYESAGQLEKRGAEPDYLFVSPLVRAQQTAAQVIRVFPMLVGETVDALTPDHAPEDVIGMLSDHQEQVLLVSHQPLVSRLIEWLTGEQVFLDTANIACVEIPLLGGKDLNRRQGDLLWVI